MRSAFWKPPLPATMSSADMITLPALSVNACGCGGAFSYVFTVAHPRRAKQRIAVTSSTHFKMSLTGSTDGRLSSVSFTSGSPVCIISDVASYLSAISNGKTDVRYFSVLRHQPKFAFSARRHPTHEVTVSACHFSVHAPDSRVLGPECRNLFLGHSTTIVALVVHH